MSTNWATETAEKIRANAADFNHKRITFNEFTERNLALWGSVLRDEQNIIGSECNKRMVSVQQALNEPEQPVLIVRGNAYRLSPSKGLQTAPLNGDGSFDNEPDEWSGDIEPEAMDDQCKAAHALLMAGSAA